MGKKTKSIKRIFVLSMICIMIFQGIFFICTIISGGVLGSVVNYSFDPLLETTDLRKAAVESKLNNCSNMLTNYNNTIKNELQNMSIKYGGRISDIMADANIKNTLFSAVALDLKNIAAAEGITGSFIILDYNKDITTTAVDALYIRSASNSGTNILSLAIGNEAYLGQLGIEKYPYWRNQLNFTEMDATDFYTEPLRLGEEYKNISTEKLGYWSYPYDINNSNVDCIAYCLPLRDSGGVTYGVIGVELNLSYIQSCLPYFELNSKGQGSYVIGVADSFDSSEFTCIATSGDSFNKINQYADSFEYNEKESNFDIYTIEPKAKVLSKVYATKDKLEINTLAEYNHNDWIISGVVDGIYLLSFVNKLKFKIILCFVLTAIAGIIFAFLAAKFFAKPIDRFVNEVKQISPINLVTPKPIFITEFSELGSSIERLTKDLSDFSLKASLIINMAGVPVGAFEYDKNSDFVFCTDILFDILKINNEENKLYVSRREFEDKISMFIKNIEPNIDKVYKISNDDEPMWVHIKTAVNNEKILGTLRDVTAETIAEHRRIHDKEHDPLTGLLNRDAFNGRVKKRIAAKKMGISALMIINLDDVSYINKEYGTITGDFYIKAAAEVLSKFENQYTIVARIVGDEFYIFMSAKNQSIINAVIEKIMTEIRDCGVESRGDTLELKLSAGVAFYPKDTSDYETLIQYAEFAMNTVKRTTKNGLAYFTKEAFDEHIAAAEGNKDIDDMIKNMVISYAYQPIVDTSTGEIYGYEALMRPDNKDVTPDVVLEYALENNLNNYIEKITWVNSLKGYTEQVDCLSPKKIFINSMPSQLLSDEDIAEIEANFHDHLDNIVIEVVECEQIEQDILSKKREIKERWNCMIALDDYGSGYSNDNTLLSVKPDLIKLDIELVTDIETDADRQALVKNIVSYAHNRDIKVLAEGIENKEQMFSLLSIGVDLLQGFYLARPDTKIVDSINPQIKEEIVNFDPNDMFTANVGLSL